MSFPPSLLAFCSFDTFEANYFAQCSSIWFHQTSHIFRFRLCILGPSIYMVKGWASNSALSILRKKEERQTAKVTYLLLLKPRKHAILIQEIHTFTIFIHILDSPQKGFINAHSHGQPGRANSPHSCQGWAWWVFSHPCFHYSFVILWMIFFIPLVHFPIELSSNLPPTRNSTQIKIRSCFVFLPQYTQQRAKHIMTFHKHVLRVKRVNFLRVSWKWLN